MSSSLVSANHEIAELRAKLDASERACAEMRDVLSKVTGFTDHPHAMEDWMKIRDAALSSTAGHDYVPRSEVDKAYVKLRQVEKERESANWQSEMYRLAAVEAFKQRDVAQSEVEKAWRKGMTDAHDIVWRANDDILDSRNPVNVVRQLCDDIRKTRDALKT